MISTPVAMYIVCEGIVCGLIVSGNILVITTFATQKYIRTVTSVYIFSLSVADFFVGAVGIPIYLYSMVTHLPSDLYGCLFVNMWIMTLSTVSIFHLVSLSLDRFLIVCHHRAKYCGGMNHQKERRACIMISSSWILGIFVGCFPLLGWNGGNKDEFKECVFVDALSMEYLMFLFLTTIVLPTILMIYFYVCVYRVLRNQVNTARASFQLSLNNINKRRNMRNRVTSSLVTVVIVFLICWYPLYVHNVYMYVHPDARSPNGLIYVLIVLSHLASAANPIIYAYSMPGFKEAFLRVICCDWSTSSNGLMAPLAGTVNLAIAVKAVRRLRDRESSAILTVNDVSKVVVQLAPDQATSYHDESIRLVQLQSQRYQNMYKTFDYVDDESNSL